LLHTLWPVFPEKNQVHENINLAQEQVSAILKATGQKFEEAEVTKVFASLKGKKLDDVKYKIKYS
jgi:ribosomal protein L12E/L44/L45/RPP1/RPP2